MRWHIYLTGILGLTLILCAGVGADNTIVHVRQGLDDYAGTADMTIHNPGVGVTTPADQLGAYGSNFWGEMANSLVRFDGLEEQIPPGSAVLSASITLTYYHYRTVYNDADIEIYTMLRDWHDPNATWDTYDAAGALAWQTPGAQGVWDDRGEKIGEGWLGERGIGNPYDDGRQWEFELTATVVQGWIDDPNNNHGMLIVWDPASEGGLSDIVFRGSDDPCEPWRPTLKVTLSEAATVPDVLGLTQLDAVAAIEDANFVVGRDPNVYSDVWAEDRVADQNPAGGTARAVGSVVSIALSKGSEPTVPAVIGLPEPNAVAAIEAAGLVVQDSYVDSCTVPIDEVMSQDPNAGERLPHGSTVSITVSQGVAVPNVVGMTRTTAQTTIEAECLAVGTETYEYNSAPVDEVIAQVPASGARVNGNTAVNLTISLGPEMVTVPGVVGTIYDPDAKLIILSGNLTVGLYSEDCSNTIDEGKVISQNPAAGAIVEIGTPVACVVSKGVPTMPDVVGLTQGSAESMIAYECLVIGTVTQEHSFAVPPGYVISQDPNAGTILPVGESVDLWVSLGLPDTLVPNVEGKNEANAEAAIEAAMLVPNVDYPYGVPAGLDFVGWQNPQADANVPATSVVDIYVVTCDYNGDLLVDLDDWALLASEWGTCDAVTTDVDVDGCVDIYDVVVFAERWLGLKVPDVLGMNETQAEATIVAAELIPNVIYPYGTPAGLDFVGKQDPVAGAIAATGSEVDVYVVTCDYDSDLAVNLDDFGSLANDWLAACGTECTDVDVDGFVDVTDLVIFVEHWLE